jgi:hypothetical protein
MLILVICSSSYAIKSTMYSNNEWYVCKLLTNYVLKRIWSKGVSADKYFEICDFFRENTNIHVYVWLKDDKHVIWMRIWFILKNISLFYRIWRLWLVRFAHWPTNFIIWLNRLIFSALINSHSDNTYISYAETNSVHDNYMHVLHIYALIVCNFNQLI